jgi:glycosyltransferase involved in cell wall biosynthesis
VKPIERVLIMAPFGVYPPRAGGHAAVLEPAQVMARLGIRVTLFGYGVRRFEAFRHVRPFVRAIEPNLTEYRHVSVWNWVDFIRRSRSGAPPWDAGRVLNLIRPRRLRAYYEAADVVLYESPWLFPYAPCPKPTVLVAQNAEMTLLESNRALRPNLLAQAERVEREAWTRAGLRWCFSDKDRRALSERYGRREAAVIPMAIDETRAAPASEAQRSAARSQLGVGNRYVVLFTGSWHLPNQRALEGIAVWSRRMDPAEFLFIAAGTVGRRPERLPGFRITGQVADMAPYFHAADCCINPVTEGSGVNVKLLEYLARGLPTITTPFGARGYTFENDRHLMVRDPEAFESAMRFARENPEWVRRLAATGRDEVLRRYTWAETVRQRLRRISAQGDA